MKDRISAKGRENGELIPTQEVFWPKDLLPQHLPFCRIATYSYRSNWLSRRFSTDLRKCGEQLLNILDQHRRASKVSLGKGRPCCTSRYGACANWPAATEQTHCLRWPQPGWSRNSASMCAIQRHDSLVTSNKRIAGADNC